MVRFGLLAGFALALWGGGALGHTLVVDTRVAAAPAVIGLVHDGVVGPVAGERIVSVTALDRSGAASAAPATRTATSASVRPTAGTAALQVRYVGLNLGRGADGTRRPGTRSTTPELTEITRSEIESLAVLRPGARFDRLAPAALRIEPLDEVAGRPVGTRVRVRVTANGQPVPGATVRLEALPSDTGGATAQTGPDGVVQVAIPQPGLNLFAVNISTPVPDDEDVHVIRRQASLSFTAAPARRTR